MTFADEHTRVYAPRGRIAHLLRPGGQPAAGRPLALCLLYPRLHTSWLGTGSQEEYDKAASLPLCGKCAAAAKGAAP
jgi:hypothetical protein